ncbi:MAG: protein translocase subunit SecD [Gammaproteobacteria bacterium]|nr:protein translocase subunit SecD [Gammaproteobacteria bacterium]NIN62820.1 protein translocase subunit SecD [Gammaproteobacteria bacterium]NIO63801.1 protein translocase subunit SecD [Gammaproteobacteria bacterium]NIP50179.1 protein translocase subunit SecD [Gammaproteobacteria bacterium]NIQ12397.1 protein translocase subunit SecD [Gammaproteobacteria bacterium]
MNRYPSWKYVLILIIILVGVVYALPNLYGSDPALQISSARGLDITQQTAELQAEIALEEAGIEPKRMEIQENSLLIRFDDEEKQLRAQDVIKKALGRDYIVALSLAPSTPGWLAGLGASPMFLGLDLRGGVHFLMEVDMEAAIRKAEESHVSELRSLLRENKIRYKTIGRRDQGGVLIRFQDAAQLDPGEILIDENFRDVDIEVDDSLEGEYRIILRMSEDAVIETRKNALQQNITTLRKRVNELGVAEPVIQQQGDRRVVVELPGVQDTARAKEILGATATLEFRMVDDEHSVQDAVQGRVPAGSKLYSERNGNPILLKKRVMLTGDHIIDAASGIDPDTGGPQVNITLDGKGGLIFSRITGDEVGKRMATVFIEIKTETIEENGELVKRKITTEEVINAATIQSQLGKRFRITGLESTQEARNLALLLRAGALAAPIEIIEERTVGPSLGKDNIEQGYKSVIIGFVLVLIFMAVYYRLFGMIANLALALNVVLLVALMSMLQATLTLPGIAGIVLTVGMAIDANVLIFERIREEIRNGNSPHASIHAGYEKAFSTIADANITTLIAAVVLFGFGTGPIKGFAVTLSLGIICSMFTAIMVSRAVVNAIYGGKKIQKLMI